MQLTIYHPGTSAVWADALFASVLQRSDNPSAGQVRKAIAAAVRAYGGLGCVQRVAQEFGDHPEAAVDRMRWARAVATSTSACKRSTARSRPAAGNLPGPMNQASNEDRFLKFPADTSIHRRGSTWSRPRDQATTVIKEMNEWA